MLIFLQFVRNLYSSTALLFLYEGLMNFLYLIIISHVPDHNYKMTFCDLLYSIINDIELPTHMDDAFRIVKPSLCSVYQCW
jgi:hypothetical protein